MQALLDDGDQNVNRYGDPELRLDRVFRGTEESFDPKMLFDPFERRADILPTKRNIPR